MKRLIVPALADLGFTTNHRRRIFRRVSEDRDHQFVQIVSFQIGSKTKSGCFTVNLGVFCPQVTKYGPSEAPRSAIEVVDCLPGMTRRLGFLFEEPQGAFVRALGLKRRRPFDYWWKLHEDTGLMARELVEVRDCLLSRGIAWLEHMATSERLQLAKRELDERKRSLAGSDEIR